MTARIFIHPRANTQAGGNHLAACLADHGYDMVNEVMVYHHNNWLRTSRVELVRWRGPVDGGVLYERMDGVKFVHQSPQPLEVA